MARVGRLAGAILVETRGEWFLVGDTKAPCDWAAAGFEAPGEIGTTTRLVPRGAPTLRGPWLAVGDEGEALARALAERFVIARNGSVSERLWRLVLAGGDPDAAPPEDGAVDARWLDAVPPGVWRIVRDAVLRCM